MTTTLTPSQQELAATLFDIGAIKFGAFKLKLHEKKPDEPLSPIFLNLRTADNPKPGPLTLEVLNMAALEMDAQLRREFVYFEAVAPLPRAGDPFAEAYLRVREPPVPCILLRKEDNAGDGNRAITSILNDGGCSSETVLVMDDLITGADSKMEAIDVLSSAGYVVTDVEVLVDREQGGREQLSQWGVTLHSVFTLSELLDFYVESGRIETSQRETVRTYFRYTSGKISLEEYYRPQLLEEPFR